MGRIDETGHRIYPADNLVNSAEFWIFKFFLFLSRLNFISAEFFWILPNFWKSDGFVTFWILKSRRILKHWCHPLNPNIIFHCNGGGE
jgi:hypothetical protein